MVRFYFLHLNANRHFVSYLLGSFIGLELWLAARCSLKGDKMHWSLQEIYNVLHRCCSCYYLSHFLNVSSVALGLWTSMLVLRDSEMLVSKTLLTKTKLLNHLLCILIIYFNHRNQTLNNISLELSCILNPHLK